MVSQVHYMATIASSMHANVCSTCIQMLFSWYMVVPFTGYPNKGAAHIALETVRKWLEINADKVCITACTTEDQICTGHCIQPCALSGLFPGLLAFSVLIACSSMLYEIVKALGYY